MLVDKLFYFILILLITGFCIGTIQSTMDQWNPFNNDDLDD